MKKSIFMLAIIASTMVTSCKNNSEKEADAVEKVQDANDDLNAVTNDVNNDAITKANDGEWQTYKMEAKKTIDLNETRIADLQNAIKKPGKTFDDNYKKSITALEDRNSTLKTKIADYENNQTDWETFKREFDSDMAGLGKAFEDLGTNNKN